MVNVGDVKKHKWCQVTYETHPFGRQTYSNIFVYTCAHSSEQWCTTVFGWWQRPSYLHSLHMCALKVNLVT